MKLGRRSFIKLLGATASMSGLPLLGVDAHDGDASEVAEQATDHNVVCTANGDKIMPGIACDLLPSWSGYLLVNVRIQLDVPLVPGDLVNIMWMGWNDCDIPGDIRWNGMWLAAIIPNDAPSFDTEWRFMAHMQVTQHGQLALLDSQYEDITGWPGVEVWARPLNYELG